MIQTALLRCNISRSGFSGERVVRLDELGYVGVAPVHYFTTISNEPLTERQPDPGHQLPGLVRATIVVENDVVVVAMPDGESIPTDQGTLDRMKAE